MIGIVPAAGLGTRLQPFTFSTPKHLIPILGRAVIEYPLGLLERLGARHIVVVIGYRGSEVKRYLESRGYRVGFVDQKKPLGIAHAVFAALEATDASDEPVVVALGDNILVDDVRNYYESFLEDYDVFILLARVADPTRYGVPVFSDGRLVDIVEKPKEPPSNYAVVGLYMFRDARLVKKYFAELKPSYRGEYEITDLIRVFIRRGHRVGYGLVEGWVDIGTPIDILNAVRILLNTLERPVLKGKVEGEITSDKVVVEEGAVVEGCIDAPAYIGKGSLLAKNARIASYTSLEEGSVVVGGVLAESAVLGLGAYIDVSGSRLEGSVVGRASRLVARNAGRMRVILGDKSVVELG